MGKKYIIELNPDCVEGECLRIPARIAGEQQWLMTKAALTPYTEPDIEQVRKEAYDEGYNAGYGRKIDASYQEGLSDAWEAAKKIASDDAGQNHVIFGQHFANVIFNTFTASEAIEKIRQYEQGQEYHVGDEFENGTEKFVVLKMDGKEIDRYIDRYGKTYVMAAKYSLIRKTGRHFPEISAVLEKMRGEQE